MLTFGADTQTIADQIADLNGSAHNTTTSNGLGGTGGATAVAKSGGGTLTLSGANTYTGGTTLSGGTLDLAVADTVSNGAVTSGAAGTGAITFAGTAATPATLALEGAAQPGSGGTFATTLSGFGANDALDLKGFTFAPGATAVDTNGTLAVTSNGTTESFTLASPTATTFYAHPDSAGTGTLIDTVASSPVAPVAPTISGLPASENATGTTPITPFAGVSVADSNGNAPTETLSITQTGAGTLSGMGLVPVTGQAGTYTITGSAATVTSELDALSFTPPGGKPNTSPQTSFTLSDTSSAGPTSAAASTTITDTVAPAAPTISGLPATKGATGTTPLMPFAGVSVADSNAGGEPETLTITQTGAGTLSGTGLVPVTGQAGTYTITGSAITVTNELDALSFTPPGGTPNTSPQTSFTLSDTSSAGPTSAPVSTTITDTVAPVAPTTNSVPIPPAPPSVAFDPTVSFSDPNTATLTGTVSDASGVKSVEIFEGTTDLGSATVDSTAGTWAFTYGFAPGFHTGLSALVTGNDGVSASTPSSYDLTTGVTGEPYAAYQDNYDPASGAYEGQTFFTRRGALEMQTQYSPIQDGGYTVLSSGGTAFSKTPYFAIVDTYDAAGQPVEEDVYYKDGHQTVSGLAPGETLDSIQDDTFYTKGGGNSFVFNPHFGQDTITSFRLGGSHHDTISLPDNAATRLGSILAHATTDAKGDTTLHLDAQNSITIRGVSVAELKQHRNDFTFHA